MSVKEKISLLNKLISLAMRQSGIIEVDDLINIKEDIIRRRGMDGCDGERIKS